MFNSIYLRVLFLFSLFLIYSYSGECATLQELFPGLQQIPAIQPKIPLHFVAMSPTEPTDLTTWVYWGPPKVLRNYFTNPETLSEPIIRVCLIEKAQENSTSFCGEKEIHRSNLTNVRQLKIKWGSYPVLAIRGERDDQMHFIAFVGLNLPSHDALLFQLILPNDEKKYEEAQQLWQSLIVQTVPLSEQEWLKANGHEMEEGYTVRRLFGTSLKLIAEQQEDGKVRLIAVPLKGQIKFKLEKIEKGLMGMTWNYGKPLIKVQGQFTIQQEEDSNEEPLVVEDTISILIHSVKEFSILKKKEAIIYEG